MISRKFSLLTLAALCCLFICSRAQAQQAFGYADITFDESNSTATGYASTELDYETAYYYDAEVQAQIQDENGNVLGSGSASGNPSAVTFFDVIETVLCFRITIVSSVIVAPHFLGCNGHYFDIFGFSDFWWGWFWDFGDFEFSRRTRCIFGRLIFIANIIRDIIRCLPANVSCQKDTNQLLPSSLRQNLETRYLTGLVPGINNSDHVTISCHAENPVTGGSQSGVMLRFGFGDNPGGDNGGHQGHIGVRPQGSYSRTAVRTDSNGNAETVYTAPAFGGSTQIVITADGMTNDPPKANMEIMVPSLQQLQGPGASDGYLLRGSSESGNPYHPNGHFGIAAANSGLRQIAADYRNTAFPQPQFPNGQPDDRRLQYNDQSLARGGKFDITTNFHTPPRWRTDGSHDEHRVGINCDVRLADVPNENVVINGQTVNRRALLEDIFRNNGSTRTGREFTLNHWHLRFEFNNQNVATVGSVPVDGVPAALPGVIEAERYDTTGDDGTAGSLVPDDGTGDPGVINYNTPQVLPISGSEDQSYVPTAGGQWMNYTTNVASSGSYSFTARVASANGGNTFHFEVDGVDRTGPLYIPNTGSADAYQFVTIDDIWLDAGQRVVRVVVDGTGDGKGNFDYFTINPYFPPQVCNPEPWEIQDCQNSGGSWDYGLCGCQYYGCYNRWCEVY